MTFAKAPAFLQGGGEAGALMRAHDWRRTPLGAPEAWPQALKTLVSLMLASRQPMFIVWGPSRCTLYNDSYGAILAQKHPAVGKPFSEIWGEVWDKDLRPIVERAYAGEAIHMDDIPLIMLRKGYPEETHFSFSYTPIHDAEGRVAGFFCPCTEITEQVFEEQRAQLRVHLTERLRDLDDPGVVLAVAEEVLQRGLNVDQVICETSDLEPIIADFSHCRDDLKRGQAVAFSNVAQDRRTAFEIMHGGFRETATGAFLIVPLVRSGHLVALFHLRSAKPRYWHPLDLTFVQEVAERAWAVFERVRADAAVRQSEERFRAFVTASSDVIFQMSPDCRQLFRLDGRGFFGRAEDLQDDWVTKYIHPDDQAQVWEAIAAAIKSKSMLELEHRVVRGDGTVGWTVSRAVPLLDDAGRIKEWFGTARDISGRKKAEEHRTLLVNELNHRVKNTLAIVQGLAHQTFRVADAANVTLQKTLEGRLAALAAAHDLLTQENWEKAFLHDVVRDTLPLGNGDFDRIRISGPAVVLPPKQVVTMAMALHELFTNAVKYGALSNEAGVVELQWTLDDIPEQPRLQIIWQECGGPPAPEPIRRGFGSRMIEQGLAQDFDGDVVMNYQPQGLVCVLRGTLPPVKDTAI